MEDKDVNGAFTEEGALVRTNAACEPNVRITWRLPRCIYDVHCVYMRAGLRRIMKKKKETSPVVLSTWQSNRKRNKNTRARFIRNRSETVAFAVIVPFIRSCSCTAPSASLFKRRREETALLVSTLRRQRRRAKTFVRSASKSSYF